MKKIVVLYHANCPDGFGAAWAARKKLGKKADYIAVDRGLPLPKGLKNKLVYSVDFTHSEPMFSELLKIAKEVIFIDHHITAKDQVKRGAGYSFDLNHSGSVLTWKYFHPKKPVPKLLRYIEDMDLWHWRLPFSREIISYLNLYEFSFSAFNKLAGELEKKMKLVSDRGKLLLRYDKILINRILEKAYLVNFEGYKVLAVNSPLYRSELGHELVKMKPPIGIIWYQRDNKVIRVSLRSNGKVDVAKIATKYGSGGHKAASAFITPVNKPFPWKRVK
ncbi:MAG: DHHA1 domain-containing protein [Patescibacteria group bacterium]